MPGERTGKDKPFTMPQIHFIAIGGAVMHNLAIALKHKGYQVSGSDDEIFDPARSFLEQEGLLPAQTGWFPGKIHPGLEAVILGMHARADNPELLRARELGLRIYSFPEYMYEQTRDKLRAVIGGSHGKTTITSAVMHVLRSAGKDFDYLVGSRLPGFDTMVDLVEGSRMAVFEGDEYLSSPLDPRPKFHLYHPHVALLSGVAWDHMNVFPSLEDYHEQFTRFIGLIEPGGVLIYAGDDPVLAGLVARAPGKRKEIAYQAHPHLVEQGQTFLLVGDRRIPVRVFGRHNMSNLEGARLVCRELGLPEEDFYRAIPAFTGAARRLEKLGEGPDTAVYLDFAHAPSKVKATTEALSAQYPDRALTACLELHTFSSLNPAFLPQYRGSMAAAGEALVYFSPATVAHKKLPPLTPARVREAFDRKDLEVFTEVETLREHLGGRSWKGRNLLMMSSGHFGGLDVKELAAKITGGMGGK